MEAISSASIALNKFSYTAALSACEKGHLPAAEAMGSYGKLWEAGSNQLDFPMAMSNGKNLDLSWWFFKSAKNIQEN